MSKKNYVDDAKQILKFVGGESNVTNLTHCMTRLRFNLKDMSIAKDSDIQKLSPVVGVNRAGNQYQVIIGPEVSNVYDSITPLLNDSSIGGSVDDPATALKDSDIKKKKSAKDIVNIIFDYMAGSLTPLIPILLAASFAKTIAAIIGPSMMNIVSTKSDIYTLFTFVGDAGFYFLPVFIGWTAAKKLNTSIPISMMLGAILIHPTVIGMASSKNPSFSVYGIPTQIQNYSSTVIPMLLTVWIFSYVYGWFKKYTPQAIKVFAVPFGSLLVMLPITLSLLAPLGGYLGKYIAAGLIGLNKVAGPLAVAILGATFTLLVLTGMHVVLLSFLFTTFPTIGYDNFMLPAILACSWAGFGVAIACIVKFKKSTNKELTFGYVITWLFGGVGEPLLYGLNIPYKTPLVAGIVSGAISGLVAGFLNLTAHVLNTSNGIYGIAAFIGGSTQNYIALGITLAVSVVSGFVVMMFMPLKEKAE